MTLADLRKSAPTTGADYDADLYAWAMHQAELLRAGRFAEVDAANVAEELETLGRSEFRAYVSAYCVVLLHMLKWDYQVDRRSRSWATSIAVQRNRLKRLLEDNPSFRPRTDDAIARAYEDARELAADETELPLKTFPMNCPYDAAAIIDRPFERD